MIFQAKRLEQDRDEKKIEQPVTGNDRRELNESVRHSHWNMKIDKKMEKSYSRQNTLRVKEIRNERLGRRRKNRTANEDGEKKRKKKSTGKQSEEQYVQID